MVWCVTLKLQSCGPPISQPPWGRGGLVNNTDSQAPIQTDLCMGRRNLHFNKHPGEFCSLKLESLI